MCAAAAKVPALGLPGAGGWNTEYVPYFQGIDRIAVWREPDDAGTKLTEDIGRDIPNARVISHPVAKDPADLFRLVGADEFRNQIEDLWKNAPSASQLVDDARNKETRVTKNESNCSRKWASCSMTRHSPRGFRKQSQPVGSSAISNRPWSCT